MEFIRNNRGMLRHSISRITLHVMKQLACIFILGLMHANASVLAQKVSLHYEKASLEKIFKDIGRQTGYSVIYDGQIVENTQAIGIHVNHLPLKDALSSCLQGTGLIFTINNDSRIITIKKGASSVPATAIVPPASIQHNVTIHVTDSLGQPLFGANVYVKGTKQGGSTDAQGNVTLAEIIGDENLVITFIGYESKEIKAGNQDLISVVLKISTNPLDEIQMIAYGQTSKRLNTGAVSTVKASDIDKQPVDNPLLALQGRMPGVDIQQNTGIPGSYVQIRIRGKNSIDNGNEPLIIVDGIEYPTLHVNSSGGPAGWQSPLYYLNPKDIESIDVLKDADATAIYGSRGANGVILITTKKGKIGAAKIDINVSQGFEKVPRELPVLNTQQYLQLRKEALSNDNMTAGSLFPDYDLTQWDQNRYTDWQKVLIGGTGLYTDVQSSLSGGDANTQYLFSAGYQRQSSFYPGKFANQKASGKFNINHISSNRKFKATFTGEYLVDDQKMPGVDLGQFAITLAPNAPSLYNADGSLNWDNGTFYNNPVAYTFAKFKSITNTFLGNAGIGYEITKGLELKTEFGYTNIQTNNKTLYPLTSMNPYYAGNVARSEFAQSYMRNMRFEPQLTYKFSPWFGGKFESLLGFTIQGDQTDLIGINASGFSDDALLENIASAATLYSYSQNSVYKYNALFARINYNLKDKYLLNLTGRRDGSSRFGPNKRFSNFGAVGVAWIFSNENFISKNFPFLSFGKLRGSYGISGNDQIGDFRYVELYGSNNSVSPYQGISTLTPQNFENPNYAWEINRKLELGLELGFFKDRLLFTADYYRNRSSNQLVSYPLPSYTGFSNVTANLPATVQNSGLELVFGTINIRSKSFTWQTDLNVSFPRNKLVSYPDFGSSGYINTWKIGKSINATRVFHYMGVDPDKGTYLFGNSAGKPVETPSYQTDMSTFLDFTPKFTGGIENSFSFHNFQMSFFWQFDRRIRRKYMYSVTPGYNVNQPVWVLDRWQKKGDVARYQRYNQDFSISTEYIDNSDFWFGDASFARLKNISLAYNLPNALINKFRLSNAKLYLEGQNIITLSHFEAWDPETGSNIPPLRVITLGMQITF